MVSTYRYVYISKLISYFTNTIYLESTVVEYSYVYAGYFGIRVQTYPITWVPSSAIELVLVSYLKPFDDPLILAPTLNRPPYKNYIPT